jgi:hypothetical protein
LNRQSPALVLAAVLVCSTLTACGGGGGSSTTAAATIAPSITSQPVAVSVALGAAATLSVTASGDDLTYQWYKAGTAITGATSSSYSIAATIATDLSTYYVIVTNSKGSVTSNTVSLNVTSLNPNVASYPTVALANAFTATLSDAQKTAATSTASNDTVLFPYTRTNNIAWSGQAGVRHGLRLDGSVLTADQLSAANNLVNGALSASGAKLLSEVRAADDILNAAYPNAGWGGGLYWVSIIGTPVTDAPWMLQVSGHNISYNITYNGLYDSATPMFAGAEPTDWTTGGVQHAPLETQRQAVYNLANALQYDATTGTTARLGGTFTDLLMGAGADGDTNFGSLNYPVSGRGAPYSSLSDAQKAYVKAMIEAWVRTQKDYLANSLIPVYEDEAALAQTYVGFAPGANGTADFAPNPNSRAVPLSSQNSYLRIDGPRVWIEFIVTPGSANPNQVAYRSVWRDKLADYGGSFGPGLAR